MNMINKMKKKKRRGFTLVELVVVIAILGILGSIGVTKFSTVQANSKEKADYVSASNIATAAKMALADGKTTITVASLVTDGYLEANPKCQSEADGEFEVSADDKNILVSVGTKQVYPKK